MTEKSRLMNVRRQTMKAEGLNQMVNYTLKLSTAFLNTQEFSL